MLPDVIATNSLSRCCPKYHKSVELPNPPRHRVFSCGPDKARGSGPNFIFIPVIEFNPGPVEVPLLQQQQQQQQQEQLLALFCFFLILYHFFDPRIHSDVFSVVNQNDRSYQHTCICDKLLIAAISSGGRLFHLKTVAVAKTTTYL